MLSQGAGEIECRKHNERKEISERLRFLSRWLARSLLRQQATVRSWRAAHAKGDDANESPVAPRANFFRPPQRLLRYTFTDRPTVPSSRLSGVVLRPERSLRLDPALDAAAGGFRCASRSKPAPLKCRCAVARCLLRAR